MIHEELPNKRDGGKAPLELLPTLALEAVSVAFGYGAAKYKAWSWRGLPNDRTYASVLRHLFAWQRGEVIDPESGLPHLWHAASQLLVMIENEQPTEGA